MACINYISCELNKAIKLSYLWFSLVFYYDFVVALEVDKERETWKCRGARGYLRGHGGVSYLETTSPQPHGNQKL